MTNEFTLEYSEELLSDKSVNAEQAIRSIIRTSVEVFAQTFIERHIRELEDPEGTINMKVHNIFISLLGEEIQYYTSLSRSLDSSLGNMLETMAINIAKFNFEVYNSVEGEISINQIDFISRILESYTRHPRKIPLIEDYQKLRTNFNPSQGKHTRKASDYYIIDKKTKSHFLIELKIGGDLDNKKARSEKEAILEQFAILANQLDKNEVIKIYFATAYNRYGEDKEWKQTRVKQYFAEEELLIGRDFWNFICKSKKGYYVVLDEYRKNSYLIKNSLNNIKKAYLK